MKKNVCKDDRKVPSEEGLIERVIQDVEKSSGTAGSPFFLVSLSGPKTGVASSSRKKNHSLSDVISLLLDIQGEQTSLKRDTSTMQNMVNEVFYDEGYIQDVDPNQSQNVDDNNNQDIDIIADLEEVVEPPSKKQKTSIDSNVKEAEASTSSGNILKTVGNDCKAKDTVDVKINDDIADVVNGFVREGISDEKYSEIMRSIARSEHCTSLTKTGVNQLVWDLLLPQTKSFNSVIQQHQETIIKAASNVTKLLNKLKQVDSSNEEKCKQDRQACMDMGMESLALMAQYNKMTNLKRKEYQQFDLSPQYHHLCSASVPFTDQLYGDNVCQKSKEIQDMNRLGRQRNNRGRSAFGQVVFKEARWFC